MAINDVLGLSVDITANTDSFVRALQAAAASFAPTFDAKDLVSKFKDAQSSIKGIFAQTVADAASAGLGRARLDSFVKKLSPITDNIESSMKRIFEQQVKIQQGGMNAAAEAQLKAAMAAEQEHLRGLQLRLKIERTGAEKIIKRRKEAVQEAERLAQRTASEAGEEFGESLGKAFEDLKSGNVGGIFKGAGKRAGAWGEGLKERGAARKAEGKAGGGMMEAMGGLLSKLGPALLAIGAIAAGFAAVVAVIIQADAAVKDMNRTLMASGIAGVDLVDQFGRAGATMKRVSQGFMESFTFNRLWGTTAKDHIEILGAYAEAGMSFKTMTEGVKNAGEEMERLKQFTVAALTYSKLLGLSTKEVSESMATYMMDLGFTLEGVQGKFANITRAAMDSGFATKRFFNMVLQATSGMSMYNVRLEEAASLLKGLAKILGAKMGGDMLQTLTKGFKDESTQDRVKKTMTTGVGYSLDTLKKDAVNSSEEFKRKMDDLGKTAAGADSKKELESALDDVMGAGASQKSPEELMKAMAKLSTGEQAKIVARAESSKNPAMVRMLAELMNKSQAFGGKGLASAQAARQFAGAGAVLDLQLNEVRGVLGKSLDQIDLSNMEQRMAWESITGKSGEEALKLFEVGKRFSGRQEVLMEEQQKIRDLDAKGKTDEAQDAAKAFNDRFGKEFGVVLDDQGNRFKAKIGLQGGVDVNESLRGEGAQRLDDTRKDMMLTAGDELLGKEGAKVSEDTLLAQEIASNTTDISKILEQGVEYLLSKIYSAVQFIASMLGHGLDPDEKQAKGRASQGLQSSVEATREEMMRQQKKASDLKRGLRGKSGADKDADLVEINKAEEAVKVLSARAATLEAQVRAVERIDDNDQAEAYGSATDPEAYVAAAAADPQVRRTAEDAIKAITGVSVEETANQVAAQYTATKMAAAEREAKIIQETLKAGGGGDGGGAARGGAAVAHSMNVSNIKDEAKAKAEGVWTDMLSKVLGIGGGVAEQPLWGFNNPSSVTSEKPLENLLGKDTFIGAEKANKAAAITLSKREMTEEEVQKKKQSDLIVAGIEKVEGDLLDKQLAATMAGMGVEGSPDSLVAAAKEFRASGTVPTNLDLNKRVIDPETGLERRAGDILRGKSGMMTPASSGAIHKRIGPTEKPADDFLMHLGSDGQVKFAQRIDGQDTVALATKSGGGIDAAMSGVGRGGGGGGTIIINHNYNDGEGVRKSWRSLQAAKALG